MQATHVQTSKGSLKRCRDFQFFCWLVPTTNFWLMRLGANKHVKNGTKTHQQDMLILHHHFFVTNKHPASKVIVRVHLMILTLRTQVSSRKGVCRILFLKDFGIGIRKPNPYGEMFWIARVKCFHFKSPNAWMILANMQLMLHPKQINITTWIGQKDAKRHCWCFCWLKNKAI